MKKIIEILKKMWWIPLLIIIVMITLYFSINCNKKEKSNIIIKDTALIIEEIKQVKELISAQYFGEVYADLYEIYNEKNIEIKAIKEDKTLTKNEKNSRLKKLFKTYTRLENYKESNKPILVYIGRGWVNAVVDLKTLQFKVKKDPVSKISSININVDSPKLIAPVINPYFIPEKKIPGYDIFIGENDTSLTATEVEEVKALCIKKLKEDAEKSNILETAKESAVNTLKKFFTQLGFQPVNISFNQ